MNKKEYLKQWHENHKDYFKKYYAANSEKIKTYQKAYQRKRKEKLHQEREAHKVQNFLAHIEKIYKHQIQLLA